jgi:hypothetical protein
MCFVIWRQWIRISSWDQQSWLRDFEINSDQSFLPRFTIRFTSLPAMLQNESIKYKRKRIFQYHKMWKPNWIFCSKSKKKTNMPWGPIRLWYVEDPTIYRQQAHRLRWGQPYAPAALYSARRFLVLIYVTGWVDPRVTVRLEELSEIKKINLPCRNSNTWTSGL